MYRPYLNDDNIWTYHHEVMKQVWTSTMNGFPGSKRYLSKTRLSLNSLWPSDAVWRHKFESTMVEVVAWGLTAKVITWTSVKLSSKCPVAFSQEVLINLIHDMCSEITFLKLPSNLPRDQQTNVNIKNGVLVTHILCSFGVNIAPVILYSIRFC